MSTAFCVPTLKAIQEMLQMLCGDDLEVSAGSELPSSECHIANFIDDDDVTVAVGVCDGAFAAYTGASLSMIPQEVAKRAASKDTLPEAMSENFHEVMNICTRLLIRDPGTRLRLEAVYAPGQAETVLAAVESATERSDFQVEIPRYGLGQVSFLVT